jgi:glyoxylase-like metal-dependent hydrolase (beta-lactamase superfamily II)
MTTEREHIDRRTFLGVSASCSAHFLCVAAGSSPSTRQFLSHALQQRIIAREPWGRLEQIGEGLWALISTPLDGDRTTLCNGGIIAGSDGVLVVESFATPEGAAWMAQQAQELAGRAPSHVVLTHYHGDHTSGIEGYQSDTMPRIMATEVTRDLVQETDAGRGRDPNEPRGRMLAEVSLLNPTASTRIDLGGRVAWIHPREGHTPSDVTVEIEEPSVVFCGDLVWNRMFPNYRDAIPTKLSRDVRALVRDRESVYVPGHGPLANSQDLERYIQVIDDVGAAARRAIEGGTPAAEAAQSYRLPETLGEWTMFNSRYYEVAFIAWERELKEQ